MNIHTPYGLVISFEIKKAKVITQYEATNDNDLF